MENITREIALGRLEGLKAAAADAALMVAGFSDDVAAAYQRKADKCDEQVSAMEFFIAEMDFAGEWAR